MVSTIGMPEKNILDNPLWAEESKRNIWPPIEQGQYLQSAGQLSFSKGENWKKPHMIKINS